MGKDHGVVNNERVTVRNVAYRQLHSHLTLHYWAYNTKRIVPTYIDVVAWKHAEKVTQFSSSVTRKWTNRFLVEPWTDPFVFLSFLASLPLASSTPLSRVFNRENSPTVLIRINSKNSHFANFLRPPLSRNLEPRTKISFSPRSKNRENRKWGNTRTKNNWKKWVEFIRKRSFRKFYLRFTFRVPRLSITDNFLDSPPFRHTTQWLEVVSLLPRDTIKNLLTRFNKKV